MQTINEVTHTTFENHIFKTRQQARTAKAHYKSIGQVCRLVDNGLTAGSKRWQVVVEVTKTIVKGFKRPAKQTQSKGLSNLGFTLERPKSGLKGFHVFYNGVFQFHRDTGYEAAHHLCQITRRMKLNQDELKQIRLICLKYLK